MKREHQQRIKEWKKVKVPVVISMLVLLFLIAIFTQYRAGTGRAIEIPSGVYTGQVIDLEKEETVTFITDFVDEEGLVVTISMNKTNETEPGSQKRNFLVGLSRLEPELYPFNVSRVSPPPEAVLVKDVLSPNEVVLLYIDALDLQPDIEASFLDNQITFRNRRYQPPPFGFTLSGEAKVSLAQGSSASTMFTVTPVEGIPADVTLTSSGLPAGVTGQFNPLSCLPLCSSQLTLSASSTAPLGNHTITISGRSELTAATTQLNLEITPPLPFDFSLSVEGNRTLWRGTANSTTVTATLLTGTPENVTFGVSSLPAGVTTLFSTPSCLPNCATTLTVTPSSSTPAGAHTIVVEARAGQFVKSIPVGFTVYTPPPPFDFTLSTVEDVVAKVGTVVPRTITATLVSGEAKPLNFLLLGLPAGVTASFNLSSCTPSCATNFTLTIAETTAVGKYDLLLNAQRERINKSSKFDLRVYAPLELAMALASAGMSIASGASAANTLTLSVISGTPQTVSFTSTGTPPGSTASFSPPSCLPPCTTSYTITSTALTPKGTYPITIIASGIAGKSNGTMELTVTAPTAPSCLQNWECGEWTACVANLQSRSCYRIDTCGQQVGVELIPTPKPETQRICQAPSPAIQPPTPAPLLCTPTVKQCFGSELQQCSYDGKTWTTAELCSYGCDSLTLSCNPAPPPKKQKPFLSVPSWSIYLAGSLAALAVIIILVVSLLGKKKYAPAKEYIKESRLKGYGDQQIRGKLISEGWEAKKIDKLLR